jgi:hypothetical protein
MTREALLGAIDSELDRLQAARAILIHQLPHRGTFRAKRVLSADARKRISDAQKRRWAKQRSMESRTKLPGSR